jgi:hypothetical protein
MLLQKIETSTATIYKDSNEVIHVIIRVGVKMDYYDALDQYLVIKNLSSSKPVLKLIDSRANWSILPKARLFLAGKEVKEKTLARAVIQNSTLKRVLLNFFNELNRPEVPTKVFTDYDEAYAWLISQKSEQT